MRAMQLGSASGVPRFSLDEELRERQPALAAFSFILLAAMAPTLVAMAIDARLFNGINVWLKPFKFELSTAVHLVTLAWFWPYLDERLRRSVAREGRRLDDRADLRGGGRLHRLPRVPRGRIAFQHGHACRRDSVPDHGCGDRDRRGSHRLDRRPHPAFVRGRYLRRHSGSRSAWASIAGSVARRESPAPI